MSFNSHPHKEDDFLQLFFTGCQTSFNSHPHKEDDQATYCAKRQNDLSTHILTRRMTLRVWVFKIHLSLSTHILTRRMTYLALRIAAAIFLSTHILTRRMTQPVLRGGAGVQLSTHILTRRMTAILNKNTLSKTARIIPFEYNTLKIYIFSNSYLLFFWKSTPFSGANLQEDFCALIIRTKISKYP